MHFWNHQVKLYSMELISLRNLISLETQVPKVLSPINIQSSKNIQASKIKKNNIFRIYHIFSGITRTKAIQWNCLD